MMLSDERYFLARVAPSEAVLDHQTDQIERSHWRGHKWWRITMMAPSGERFLPRHLPDLLQPIIAGELPSEPIALLR